MSQPAPGSAPGFVGGTRAATEVVASLAVGQQVDARRGPRKPAIAAPRPRAFGLLDPASRAWWTEEERLDGVAMQLTLPATSEVSIVSAALKVAPNDELIGAIERLFGEKCAEFA